MRIKTLNLVNYRCFRNLQIDFDDSLNVIAGINGSGKSTVLDAVAVALGAWLIGFDGVTGVGISAKDARVESFVMGENDVLEPLFPVRVAASGSIDGRELWWERTLTYSKGQTTTSGAKHIVDEAKIYQDRLRLGDKDLVLPIIAYYGTGRLWDYHRAKKADVFKDNKKINGYIDCLSGTANLKLMMDWFRKKTVQMYQDSDIYGEQKKNIQLRVVFDAMARCFSRANNIDESRFFYNLDTNDIECRYVDNNEKYINTSLSQMSDGYKCTLSLIADIAYRMAVLNPQLGKDVLKLTSGVVLIDEVDLHLHPSWQHRILDDLREIFPRVQFIVSTHAPAVISSVRSKNLVLLDDYLVIKEPHEIFGKDINSLLNEVMGTQSRNPQVAKMFESFYSSIQNEDYDQAEKILNEIDKLRDYSDPEVTTNRIKLRLEKIRGQES